MDSQRYLGVKSAKFGVLFNITRQLSHPRLKMQQDILTLNQLD